jgi:hypothetical protein
MYAFSAQDSAVPNATSVPQAVEDVVVADIRKNLLQGYEGDPGPVSTWTSGTEVTSLVPGRRLFVLMGTGVVKSANTTQFWVTELNNVDHRARILKRIHGLSFTLHYMEGEPYPRLAAGAVIAQSIWRCDVQWSQNHYVEQPNCTGRTTSIR